MASSIARAPTNVLPHEMTLSEFSAIAQAEALMNHGRKWVVRLGTYSAFSDADTPEAALADVHELEVNNALYANSPQGRQAGLSTAIPPLRVLVDYLALAEQFGVVAAIPDCQTPAAPQAPDQTPSKPVDPRMKAYAVELDGIHVVMVAARSKKAAAELIGTSVYMITHWEGGINELDEAIALAQPGQLFRKPRSGAGQWIKVSLAGNGWHITDTPA